MYSLSEYDYILPKSFVAQKPAAKRDQSRLLFLQRATGKLSHHKFYDLCDILSPEDVLVVNNTKVIPGRLFGKKDTGGSAEVLILDYSSGPQNRKADNVTISDCLVKASKTPKPGSLIFFGKDMQAEVVGFRDGIFTLKFLCNGDFGSILYRIGKVPLPPYIKRDPDHNDAMCDDRKTYQTVYATQEGAVAAPTAGLHFTPELIERLKSQNVQFVMITLHIGYGTFLPVKSSDIRNHQMHSEWYTISGESADIINRTKAGGGRIVAVGTTTVRTLEYASDNDGKIYSGNGRCDLFIFPGYRFKVIDALITNFHLPRSTLLMLVSAFAGREKVLHAYSDAKKKKYRFYSYGDAMYIA